MISAVWEHTGLLAGAGKTLSFDSFGQHPPVEWEKEMLKAGHETFSCNVDQIQALDSERCGYYCILFLNERKKATSYPNILRMLSADVRENEKVVKNYFINL